MNDDRVDLSPLDPSGDRDRWAMLVSSVVERARPVDSRPRVHAPGVLELVSGWARLALPTAALVAALSIASLVGIGDESVGPRPAPRSVDPEADMVLAGSPLPSWLASDRPPTTNDLLLAGTTGGNR